MTNQPIPPRQVRAADAVRLAGEGYRVIDVREQVEWDQGHIPGATLLPLADLLARAPELLPDKDERLLLHCAVGARSARALAHLVGLGYADVVNLVDSLGDWRRLGGAWEAPAAAHARAAAPLQPPDPDPRDRGQGPAQAARLEGAADRGRRARIAGGALPGGLGDWHHRPGRRRPGRRVEPAAAGRAYRGSHRSTEDGVGANTLEALNPETRVIEHRERLSADNVERLIAGYDVIVDGTDNFDTRYVLNDAAVKLRKPVVHGSIYRWDGQVTTFVPFAGPCYRCMYPVQPPEELAPACAVAGVLGVLPGIAGMLQANEVFKLLLGVGEPLAGRLLMFDAMTTEFSEVRIWRDPACPACGEASPGWPSQPTPRPAPGRRCPHEQRAHPAGAARGGGWPARGRGLRRERSRGPGPAVRRLSVAAAPESPATASSRRS